MHLPPHSWGPFFWHTMHITALGYPSKPTYAQKRAAKEFYESLTLLIPCPICREHYAEFLKQMPLSPSLDTRDDLFRWTVAVHNEVNKKLGKPRYTEAESIAFYTRLGQQKRSPVLTPNDFAEADLRALIRGIGIGVGVSAAVGGLIWWLSKSHN